MLKRILRDIKNILENENGYVMAAMAVASMLSANSQRNAQMKAKAADAKLQRAKLERARMRATDDFVANTQRAREASQKREVQIESNRIDAESNVDVTFAGSGISGQSINEIDAELNASVVQNKLENKRALGQQLGDMYRNYGQTMEDTAIQGENIDTTGVKGSTLADLAGAAGAAQSVAGLDAKLASSGFFKSTPTQKLSVGDYNKHGMNISKSI